MKRIWNFIHGRLGRWHVRPEYRIIWIRFWYCVLLSVAVVVFFVCLQLWQWLVNWVQYSIWQTCVH